ncbi:uncharacterized protein LOC131697750 [Acipenser ruthenus]|uniref:uncharacterized protein LOC131697750 n=1 Tax=Acipenser ruthenus TaxID=7906 RepID=UPI0027404485|nr:uncharacterized protein LOC131697750 [Acipenser ruthenus]XP_058844932.1 uncharacterized protein LOC131697750 [Acipenser ruthenus]
MALISEGIADCIDGATAMITGEFSWESWATSKAISISVSLIGIGIGKLINNGFKGVKGATKTFVKDLKVLPKMFKQAGSGFTTVMKVNLNQAWKYAGKELVQQLVMYEIGKGEEVILNKILEAIKTKVKINTQETVKKKLQREPLKSAVDRLVLSQLTDPKELKLILDPRKPLGGSVNNVFGMFFRTILEEYYRSIGWQKQLCGSLMDVINKAKAEVQGGKVALLNIIKTCYLGALGVHATYAATNLLDDFVSKLSANINSFMDEKKMQSLNACDLSEEDKLHLKQFRETLADSISEELGTLLVQTFHQKFSGHLVKEAQSKINQYASSFISNKLNTSRTVEKLKAGSASLYITHMAPTTASKKMDPVDQANLDKYIEKIKQSSTAGSVLDLKILSEKTGTKVIVSEEDKKGKLQTKHVLEPSSSSVHSTIHLVYRTASKDYPEGHYNVCINNRIYPVRSEGNSCMYHAFAQALHPEAQDSELTQKATALRELEAKTLQDGDFQLNSFLKKEILIDSTRGGDYFMSIGSISVSAQLAKLSSEKGKEKLKELLDKTGSIAHYTENQEVVKGDGAILNANHQPPLSSLLNACDQNQTSPLAKAMLQVGVGDKYTSEMTVNELKTVVKNRSGPGLPSVIVPYDLHCELLTSGNSHVAKEYRAMITEAIKANDIVRRPPPKQPFRCQDCPG